MKYIKYLSILIFVVGFFLLRPYHMQETGLMYSGDDEGYFAHASSLVFFQFPSYENESYSWGEGMPMHSIGPGLMASPFVMFFSLLDRINKADIIKKRKRANIYNSWSLFGFVIASLFFFYSGCILLYLGLKFYFNYKISFFAVVLMILFQGFPLYVFRRPVFAHIYEFFLMSVIVYLVLKNNKTYFLDKFNMWITVGIGVIIGLIPLVRYNNLAMVFVVPIILYCFRENNFNFKKNLKHLIYVYGTAFLILLIFKVYPLLLYGENYSSIIKSRLFILYHPIVYIKRIAHIFLGIDWGLIFTAPFAVIGLFSLFLIKEDKLKNVLLLLLLPIIINLYIVIVWGTQAGWYGYRYLVFSLAPAVVYPFAKIIRLFTARYGYKKFYIFVFTVSLFPLLSMLVFEGNPANLTLHIIVDYFNNVGSGANEWGNKFYQVEVWKTLIFNPLQFIIASFKGGMLYIVYIFALIFKLIKFLPQVILEKYQVFRVDIFIKTLIIYIFPFLMYFIIKKLNLIKEVEEQES
ncbi:hypothetical protein ACFL4O_01770 [bacterium]